MGYREIIYAHKNGHFYRIMHFGIDEATMAPDVAYRQCDAQGNFIAGISDGPVFHRRCSVFFDGRFWVYQGELQEIENMFNEPPSRPTPELIVG